LVLNGSEIGGFDAITNLAFESPRQVTFIMQEGRAVSRVRVAIKWNRVTLRSRA
jgi:hypothetical protein